MNDKYVQQLFIVLDEWVYYYGYDDGIYRMTVEGKKHTRLAKLEKEQSVIPSLAGVDLQKHLLYFRTDSSGSIFQCGLDNKLKVEKVTTDKGRIPLVEKGQIYYNESYGDIYRAYEIDAKTESKKEIIEELGTYNMIYDKGKILYSSKECEQLREYNVKTKEHRTIYEEDGKTIEIEAVFDDGLAISIRDAGTEYEEKEYYWLNREGEILYKLN